MLTEAQVKEIVDELHESSEFSKFRSDRVDWDNIRARRQKIPLPELYKNTGVPLYHSYEARYADKVNKQELSRAKPVYVILSQALDDKRQAGAQDFERFMNRQFVIWTDNPSDPRVLVGADQSARGVGVLKLDLRSHVNAEGKHVIWQGKPGMNGQEPKDYLKAVDEYKLTNPTPFTLERVDIMACSWFEDADGVAYFVEKSQRPLNAVLAAYGLGLERGQLFRLGEAIPVASTFSRDHVEFVELCTRDTIYHLIKHPKGRGKDKYLFVDAYPNPFGDVRYVLAPAEVSEAATVTERYVPLIEASLETTKSKSYFGTLRTFAAAQTALPIDDVVTDEGAVVWTDPKTSRPMSIPISPFRPIDLQLPPGTHLKRREGQAGPDLDKTIAFIEDEQHRYGPQEVLTGGSAGERQAAWALSIQGERAEYGIEPALRGQKKALTQIAQMVAYCVKNWVEEDVLIWTVVNDDEGRRIREQVRVRPDDIEEDFLIDMDMGYKNTAIQLPLQEALRRAVEDGFIPRVQYQEEGLGLDDPQHADRLIDQERIDKILQPLADWQAVEASIYANRAEAGLPPPPPEEVAMLRAMTFGQKPPEQAEERRAASPVRAQGLEPPPTPEGQRIV